MEFNTLQKNAIFAKENKILCLSAAGSGKALPNSTRIPTIDGWKEVGEIQVGDYLFDRKGNPTKVLGVFPQGEKEVYEITFGDGRKAKCCKDHIWRVYNNKTHKEYKNSFKDLTVQEILDRGIIITDKRGHNSARFSIPCSEAIQLPEINYDVHPYVIGAFLGDGCCTEDTLTISSADIELVQKVDSLIGQHGFKKLCKNNFSWSFYCEPYRNSHNQLVTFYKTKEIFAPYLDNICCKAHEKSIPEIYKRGSIEQRLQLLQGLFDTDGTIGRDGGRYHVRFSSTSKKLIDDIKEVLGSLGYVSSIYEDKRKNKYTNNIAYSILVKIPNSEKFKLFSLSRKRDIAMEAINKKQNRDYSRTTIRSIKSLKYTENMTCFYVDNEEHLFLMNDFLVTHNTSVITERIRQLVNAGCPPNDIIAITFTNMAAEEMKERLSDVNEGMFIGTIHSLANSLCVANGINTEAYIADADFDKILDKALTLPQSRFPKVKHVLVDEFQDICDKDFQFINKIRTDNLFVVGDDRQAIYGFRGSRLDFLEDLYRDMGCKKYNLTQNYRCAPNILSFADSLIRSVHKMSPNAVAVKQEKGYVNDSCSFNDAVEEIEWSKDYGNWFILCRTNNELATAVDILEKRGIPCISFRKGDLDLFEMDSILKDNKVKILSIHTSKGLSNKHVIVTGAKNFNSEERKIAYVAATRAEQSLYWCPSICKRGKKNRPANRESVNAGKVFENASKNMIMF